MADEAPYHGAILLLDPGLVVAAVRPRPGELDATVGAVLDQRLVDERAVVTHLALAPIHRKDECGGVLTG